MRLTSITFFLLMSSSLIIHTGCNYYDEGFEDGHDGAKKSFHAIFSDSYKSGYGDGRHAGYMYDRGRSDATNGNAPASEDPDYLDGYEYASRTN